MKKKYSWKAKKINLWKLLLCTFNTSRQKDFQLYIDIYSFHLPFSTICYILKILFKPPFYVSFILITCIQIKKNLNNESIRTLRFYKYNR